MILRQRVCRKHLSSIFLFYIANHWLDTVDNYRKSAYISSAPEEMTLEEYSSLLQAAIDK